jgi:hypothetical protein
MCSESEVAISQIFPQNWRQNYQLSIPYTKKVSIKFILFSFGRAQKILNPTKLVGFY